MFAPAGANISVNVPFFVAWGYGPVKKTLIFEVFYKKSVHYLQDLRIICYHYLNIQDLKILRLIYHLIFTCKHLRSYLKYLLTYSKILDLFFD